VKQELARHLFPTLIIFLVTSLYWAFHLASWPNFVFLFLGLLIGAFFLDIDHLVFWYFLRPSLQESRIAQLAFAKKDFSSLIKLLESTHKTHTNLIFHHYFFQIILVLISFFVFTSSQSIFVMAFVLANNLHLTIDEFADLQTNPSHLQDWLFAREKKQLPLQYLKYYVYTFIVINFIFFLLLVKFLS
jgi:hypothetical protein